MQWIQLAAESDSNLVNLQIALILGLLFITLVAVLVRRIKIPYTVALVIAGLALAFVPSTPLIELDTDQLVTSELILALLVPPLIFEGALYINWKTFRESLIPILLISVLGLLLATLIVGGVVVGMSGLVDSIASSLNLTVVEDLSGLPIIAGIAFGALISATDPVAVIAFFRSLGVDKRLAVLVEGESLLNDGTAIVIFKLALAIGGVTGALGEGSEAGFSLLETAWDFFTVSIGGLTIGLAVSALAYILILRPMDDNLVETTITLPVAFGSYVLAEQLHLSGILAVVAAGIYLGNHIPSSTTPTTKIALYNFWDIISFIVTSLIFLIIGWQIDIRQFLSIQNIILIFSAIVAILVARAIVVYGMSAISKRLGVGIQRSYQHVMFWGGLRGAISLALALSLPANTFGPGVGEQLRLMTFGVVLFTLLVQGTTIEGLIKRLGLAERHPRQVERERYLGRLFAGRSAQEELNRLNEMGIVSGSLWQAMAKAQQTEMKERDQDVRDMLLRHPGMEIELALQVRRSMMQAERTALAEAVRQEIISEEIQQELLEDLDYRLQALDEIESQRTSASPDFVVSTDEEDLA